MNDRDLAKHHTGISRIGNWAAIAAVRACMHFRAAAESRSGATAIEYGIIAAGISVAIIAALNTVGNEVSTLFDTIADGVTSATSN